MLKKIILLTALLVPTITYSQDFNYANYGNVSSQRKICWNDYGERRCKLVYENIQAPVAREYVYENHARYNDYPEYRNREHYDWHNQFHDEDRDTHEYYEHHHHQDYY